ncbi:uncharacterized protein CIMG_06481 [Coccidioides immitis RS]|uniref:Uncharacterized protein n=1 Tax=Coccidioides immitis (strain RS) TaxID=246410 RepID=J3K877_COCIM|nr:uncharacterized protein CIMG_06481 [Coccidioides immitis RS]EAS31002.3 hypothetical protein CIMG_06481 [Coccidioides immitis RS]
MAALQDGDPSSSEQLGGSFVLGAGLVTRLAWVVGFWRSRWGGYVEVWAGAGMTGVPSEAYISLLTVQSRPMKVLLGWPESLAGRLGPRTWRWAKQMTVVGGRFTRHRALLVGANTGN